MTEQADNQVLEDLGEQTEQEDQQQLSAIETLMKEKGFESEEELISHLTNLEKEKEALSEEFSRQTFNPQEPQPKPHTNHEIPEEAEEFFKGFVKDPTKVLDSYFKKHLEIYENAFTKLELDQAYLHLRSQKDYDKNMELEVARAVKNNPEIMSSKRPLARVNAALEIVRNQRLGQRPSEQPKKQATKVATPKKSASSLDTKSDSALSAAEFAKKYGIRRLSE